MKSPSHLAAYADLFQRLGDCTFLLDSRSFVVLEANPACERELGVTLDRIVGRPLLQWVESAARDDFAKALRVAMRRYHPRHFEATWINAEKKAMAMDILACPLRLADQSEVLQVIARDVSFRREAEARMQALLRELQAANAKLEVLSTVDEMTGLHNFRYLMSQIELEHTRASRYGTSYAIIYCDIDHFKKYNDRNGHLAGDRLLKEFARIVQRSIRTTDLAARYGGEEFCIVCPGVNWEGAAVVAERIRSRVESAPLPFHEGQPGGKLTVSVGVSSFPEDGETSTEILGKADNALYASKESGRNCVTAAQSIQRPKKETA